MLSGAADNADDVFEAICSAAEAAPRTNSFVRSRATRHLFPMGPSAGGRPALGCVTEGERLRA